MEVFVRKSGNVGLGDELVGRLRTLEYELQTLASYAAEWPSPEYLLHAASADAERLSCELLLSQL